MVDTCLVTGTIVAPDGTPVRRTAILFQRTPKLPFVADDASAFPAPVTARTDANGSVEVELIPGTYLVKPWYSTYEPFRIVVPDEPAARLEDIQFSDPPPPLTDAELAVLQAREARDEAREARDEAEVARGDAQAAAQEAEEARDEAVHIIAGHGIGTQPLELPRNTELGAGAFAPYEPHSLYPILPTGSRILTPDDNGKIVWSAAHDITLPDSTTPGMGPGWRVWIKNTATATSLTIDCDGAGDTIDGGASLSLAAGEPVLIVMIATGQFGSL